MNQKIISSKDLQKLLKRSVGFREYSLNEFYDFYLDILNRDRFLQIEERSKDSIRRSLENWTRVENSWIAKRGVGKNAVYYRPFVGLMSLKELTDKGRAIYKKATERCSWAK